MNLAFYNAVVGAQQQQKRFDIISNNISNINTDGYRNQKATFTDMLYSNIHDRPKNVTDLTVGSSVQDFLLFIITNRRRFHIRAREIFL